MVLCACCWDINCQGTKNVTPRRPWMNAVTGAMQDGLVQRGMQGPGCAATHWLTTLCGRRRSRTGRTQCCRTSMMFLVCVCRCWSICVCVHMCVGVCVLCVGMCACVCLCVCPSFCFLFSFSCSLSWSCSFACSLVFLSCFFFFFFPPPSPPLSAPTLSHAYRGFPTRMVYLHYISCLRYTILAGNPQYAQTHTVVHLFTGSHKLK